MCGWLPASTRFRGRCDLRRVQNTCMISGKSVSTIASHLWHMSEDWGRPEQGGPSRRRGGKVDRDLDRIVSMEGEAILCPNLRAFAANGPEPRRGKTTAERK
jgi:hypothetical protein